MSESVNRCDKVILRNCLGISSYNLIQLLIIRIGKEHRLHICVACTHMLHTVFLLITSCKLMFLYYSGQIIVNSCAYDKAILRLTVHGLCIQIIVLLIILNQPAVIHKLIKVISGFLIYPRIIFTHIFIEIYFRLYYMIKTHFVVAGLLTCLLTVQHIVWTRLNTFYQVFRWTYSFKWFYFCHYYLFTWNLVHPSLKYAFIWTAAAIPAFILASAVCAPIFLGVLK